MRPPQTASSSVLAMPLDSAGSEKGCMVELAIGYGLILATIWTPRPFQRWLYNAAVLWIFATTVFFRFPDGQRWASAGAGSPHPCGSFWRP